MWGYVSFISQSFPFLLNLSQSINLLMLQVYFVALERVKERKSYQFECCKSVASPFSPWQITRVNPFLSSLCKSPEAHLESPQRPLNTHFTCSKGNQVNIREDLILDIFSVREIKRGGGARHGGDLRVSVYINIIGRRTTMQKNQIY